MRYYIEATARALAALIVITGAVLMCAMASSCAQVDNVVDRTKGILIDCGKTEAVKASNEMGPLVETLLYDSVDGEGHVDWSPVKDAAKRWTAELSGCVLADVVSRVLAPKSNDPNAPKLSTVELNREELRQGFEQLKAERFGGVTFVTTNGMKL